ncbi:amine dehydrogenase large subunit [Sandarakinorhabdus oryzae]|uniref:amine dehydrogenase large subunit n=1 Tax=Sandarakinorhabdus oryzae TaxID=2675220 RepID=UPI0012E221FF|nr:amine dehydrogenase large subunit [Sandarakinorhabdus oryzae]
MGRLAGAALIALLGLGPAHAQTASAPAAAPTMASVEPEEPFTHTLPDWSPHWGLVRGGWENGGTRIWNGDTGKMVGLVATGRWSDIALDPKRRAIYVSETIWTKVNRGTRQDMLTVYDPKTMALVTEIPLPGRLIIGTMKNNFVLSDDGKQAFIYNFSPASSVNVVDLEKRKVAQVVELPGCASLVPVTGVGFSALCSDGTLATVTVGPKTSTVSHSQPFFKAAEDGVFDCFVYDRTKGEIVTVTYTGLVRTVKLGASPTIGDAWSIQAAAGVRPGDTRPLDINWFPGGRQAMALHRATGKLFVLMHRGEYWTQKDDGEEVWVVDMASRKVVKRVPLKKPIGNIEVTQDAKPLLFLSGDNGLVQVMDLATYEIKHDIERGGGGMIVTPDVD